MTVGTADLVIILALAVMGVATGMMSAGRCGPVCFDWRGPSTSLLCFRVALLKVARPTAAASSLGLGLVLALMAGGPLMAYVAKAPTDQARLGFSAFVAEQARDQAPSMAEGDWALLAAEQASGRWDGKAHWGLNLAETERLVIYDTRRNKAYRDWYQTNWVAGEMTGGRQDRPADWEAVGENYDDYVDLFERRMQHESANVLAEVARRPIRSPSQVYVPVGFVPQEVMSAQGVDPRGTWWLSASDEKGGRTATRVAPADFMTTYLVPGMTAQPGGYTSG